MKKPLSKQPQQGFAHLVLILIVVVVLGGIGFAGYTVMNKGKNKVADSATRAALEAACTETDKTICKFQASWKDQPYYTVVSKSTSEGKTAESTYKIEGKTKSHIISKGEMAFEMIVIDKDTYTKAANGTWWKQTAKPAETPKSTPDFAFDDSDDSDTEEVKNTTAYKDLGKEACGDLTCHKYQVVDSSAPDDKEFIWFDTKDYQLRKQRSEYKNGDTSESTFNYDKFSIKVPSPVKVLAENQYLLPGESEPQTLPDGPSAADYQNMMDSLPAGSDDADTGTAEE